jgi:hypothetical protein
MRHSAPPPRRALPLLAALALAAACTPVPPGPSTAPAPGADAGELVTSVRVQTQGDTVLFSLQLTNPSTAPVRFTFPSGQTYDFVVRGAGGGEVWRWSADRGFTQAVQSLTLRPGETWQFGERWTRPSGLRGEFTAVGRLVSSNRPVERTATFRLP